jgi:hypothetical protein
MTTCLREARPSPGSGEMTPEPRGTARVVGRAQRRESELDSA